MKNREERKGWRKGSQIMNGQESHIGSRNAEGKLKKDREHKKRKKRDTGEKAAEGGDANMTRKIAYKEHILNRNIYEFTPYMKTNHFNIGTSQNKIHHEIRFACFYR